MPEATMDEDRQLPAWEGDIRPADVSPIFSIYPPIFLHDFVAEPFIQLPQVFSCSVSAEGKSMPASSISSKHDSNIALKSACDI